MGVGVFSFPSASAPAADPANRGGGLKKVAACHPQGRRETPLRSVSLLVCRSPCFLTYATPPAHHLCSSRLSHASLTSCPTVPRVPHEYHTSLGFVAGHGALVIRRLALPDRSPTRKPVFLTCGTPPSHHRWSGTCLTSNLGFVTRRGGGAEG